ncbi:phage terminase small subunit-related protein [Paenibacillus thiaminolyticus]|uniref:phage terminase small subunit-related protein n=1 Tax=Paenibacillus thiaminolyticus TaxID=49283 RepID=UPI002542EA1A|nr:phage terminase small subunit-related protein [Paenibacillus thiaminolyticus]WII36832.1 phage terminase small subunit-related protein [Paenibacillus thiaminolyticus]
MARERSPQRDEARKMWLDNGGKMKLKDIAAALGLGETQVRKWKSVDRWADALNSNVTNESNSNVTNRRKPGAPKGNKNALGNSGGAPKRNQNAKGNRGGTGGPYGNKKAVTTGEYETIWMDALEEDEQALVEQVDTDPVQQADEAIKLLTIRERRMLQRIGERMNGLTDKQRRVLWELKAKKEVMTLHDEKTGQTKTIPLTKHELVESEIEETELLAIDRILRIEEALTRVQGQKLKAIELKNKLLDEERQVRIEKLKFELQMLRGGEADDTRDDGFIEALRGKAAEVWGSDGQTEA